MTLPADFISRTRTLPLPDFERFVKALDEEAPVSLRLNTAKGATTPTLPGVPWSKSGFYLPERLSFTFDPLFHAGAYYVQEAASMFLEQAIRQTIPEPVTCLDLCAAPGGKSTHLLNLLPAGSLLVSNEVIRNRCTILGENLTKWGAPNAVVTNNDPAEIGRLTHFFDVIVTDVPCSGEGMFRKDPESRNEWSVTNVELCAGRQRRIIQDIWEALKPGGILIYSTCTYNTEENEDNIRHFTEKLGAEPVTLTIPDEWQVGGGLKGNHPVYRFFPYRTKGEGFFLAVLRKPEEELRTFQLKTAKKKERKPAIPVIPSAIKEWLSDPDSFQFGTEENKLVAFPEESAGLLRILRENLKISSAGICLGETKGKDILPATSLALSTSFRKEAFPEVSLSWEEAIQYLRKEAIPLPGSTPKGFVFVSYDGYPLGFCKHLGNRANNLYPSEWRIRSGYLPENVKIWNQIESNGPDQVSRT